MPDETKNRNHKDVTHETLLSPVDETTEKTSLSQVFLQQLVHKRRVGLALGAAHNLPDEK